MLTPVQDSDDKDELSEQLSVLGRSEDGFVAELDLYYDSEEEKYINEGNTPLLIQY